MEFVKKGAGSCKMSAVYATMKHSFGKHKTKIFNN